MRKIIKLLGGWLILLVALQIGCQAGDKTFFIKGSNIKRNSALLTTTQIQFFVKNSPLTLLEVGGAPLTEDVQTLNGAVKAPTDAGKNVQYNATINDNLLAILWTPGVGAGNYYAKATLAMDATNYSNSSLTWLWDNLAVDYKAEAPYKPSISQFEEATTTYTNGDPSVSTLKATSVSGSGTDGLREITSYAWKWWKDGDPESSADPAATSSVLNLASTQVQQGVKYAFKAGHSNQWGGPTWSDKFTYTVAGGPGGGVVANDWTFKKTTTGINTFTVPFNLANKVKDGNDAERNISSVGKLVQEINRQITLAKVTTFGWWDETGQSHKGLTAITELNNDLSVKAATTTGGDLTTILGTLVVTGRAYQVSVSDNCSVTLKGTK